MPCRLLVPLDGSTFSEKALSLAVPIAQQHHAMIVLAMSHPVPPPIEFAAGAPVRDPALERDLRDTQYKQLQRVAKRLAKKHGIEVSPVFREGPIVDQLEQAIIDLHIDLVVMTSHGRGGLSRFWLGSVTDGLLRRTSVPMLVTRAARPWTLTSASEPLFPRLLLALDGSARAEQAIRAAEDLMGDHPTELVLARVLNAPMATVSATWMQEATRAVTAEYLEPLAARLRANGRTVTTHAAVHSDAARGILDIAKSVNAFALAIATHGRTGLSRVALGSVADKVIRASAVPVLVAPSMER